MTHSLPATALSPLFVTKALATHLDVTVYNPQQHSVFPVSSVLISGEKEVILVDAQFQKNDAVKLISIIKASNKKLTTVFISHSDPDYYFGLDVIKQNFPEVKILSTAETAYLIAETKEDKLGVWKDALKENAPSQLITPEPIEKDKLTLEGHDIFIHKSKDDPAHSFLWIPSIKTILGGVSIFDGMHAWTADTQGKKGYSNWKARLNEMKELSPEKVIPGHFIRENNTFSPASIDFTKQYLTDFEAAVKNSTSSAELVAIMQGKYANLAVPSNLELSAKVAKNEMAWHVGNVFPAIGEALEVKFGDIVFDLTFHDNEKMSFIGTSGAFKGVKDNVTYRAVEIADHVFMLYWHEPSTGSNVVHVEDFNSNTVYTNIAATDGSFTHLKGVFSIKSSE